MLLSALLLGGDSVFMFGCTSPSIGQPASIPETKSENGCTPSFPFLDGWWGADGAYSIPLADGRSVWIFGDTFYGDSRTLQGEEPRMVRNSVGVSTCTSGRWKIKYVLRRTASGKPIDFFQSPVKDHWYWAMDGFMNEGVLYVTLLCVRDKAKTQDAPYGFETCGADLARVSDLEGIPEDWTIQYFPLVPLESRAFPSATAVVDGEYAYIFALNERASTRPLLLTRIPLAHLDSPQESIEYYARDGHWKSGFVPRDAAEVMKAGSSELSVRYHPELEKWVAILVDPSGTGVILMRTATKIEGPWTQGRALYRLPELAADSRENHPNWFCYAGKEHPEFSQPNTLLITYVCNSLVPKELLGEPDLYLPEVVHVPIPASP
jgi:hypothetical protein